MPEIGSPLLWAGFGVFIAIMLALDLGVFHRDSHLITHREALIWTIVWVSLALTFNVGIYFHFGPQRGLEFLTAYIIEYSLSVDNIFVFILIFKYFAVNPGYQHRILFWGILGALVMRLAFIVMGAALLQRFEWIVYLFGGLLVWAGIKMLKEGEVEVHPEQNFALRLFKKFVRVTHDHTAGEMLLKRQGQYFATPLLLVLVVVEATDLIFAVDSIPAVFAVTRDPFIAFTSNIFAILGLRSLYFLLAGAMGKFHYLKYGLGLVLVFVGGKMLISGYFHISTGVSLSIVGGLLGSAIAASFLRKPVAPVPAPPGPPKKSQA